MLSIRCTRDHNILSLLIKPRRFNVGRSWAFEAMLAKNGKRHDWHLGTLLSRIPGELSLHFDLVWITISFWFTRHPD
jgi:hypothetical protein